MLFAALFVSGLYISGLEKYHDELDPYEYTIRYGTLKPEIEEEELELETDENGEEILPPPDLTDADIEMIFGESKAEAFTKVQKPKSSFRILPSAIPMKSPAA